ncbi:hypothetical protein [Plantactinospora sp. CA-290183]|uniref:hypothetical protein n=1 Tax=Plantactinospora sp. CA-290183 TaxID=3240006 RepID=UPI003D94BA00
MKAHRTDGMSLTFALIFLGIAAWWLLAQLLHLALPAVGWFLAVALIVLGALGLLAALRSNRTRPDQAASEEPRAASEESRVPSEAGPTAAGASADPSAIDPARRPGVDPAEPATAELPLPGTDPLPRPVDPDRVDDRP